eukprot:2645380-Pyramimonas_sp.AAC.1
MGKPHIRNPFGSTTKGSIGKPHNRNLLEIATKGLYWKASQQGSSGQHNNEILFENLTTGILWTESVTRDSIGKPHNRNPLEKQRSHLGGLR